MKSRGFLVLLLSLLVSHQAFAIVTSPTSAEASSTFFSYSLASLINGDGLSGGLEGGLHGESYPTMWMSESDDRTPTLTFDMGETVNFLAAHIWQYNSVENGLSRGVNGFNILYSSNGVDFTPLGSANLTISPGGPIPAQIVPMVATARFIRFEITSNHGDTYTGLSEVAFDIQSIQAAAPIPANSQWALIMLSMLIGLTVFANRKHLF